MIPVLQKTKPLQKSELNDAFALLIDKEESWTSFDVVNKLRYFLKIKKVGHAGTLDPFATGLLIIGVGKGTKSLQEFSGLAKSYQPVICLGVETDTLDKTGKIIAESSVNNLTIEKIGKAVESLKGEIEQMPPMYSAKKVNGQRLYKLARKNKEIARKPVKVTIHRADILEWEAPVLKMDMAVSKGTYIRSYADDLGKKLGCGAHLQNLKRTAIGPYKLEDSFTISEFMYYWTEH
ncbi:MAG: tRNA pseudouridine(55) synthase TruB [Calditrichaceae bacterium]|nr:tRNA pseudouridine(55) synthase TruB [Calditrichaceae bacterium]HES60233.1 tRNA pseudouridine(55) synthase TruB [Caldithrix sp.]